MFFCCQFQSAFTVWMARRRLYCPSNPTCSACGQCSGLFVRCPLKDVPDQAQAMRCACGRSWRGRRSPKGSLTLLNICDIPYILVSSGSIGLSIWKYCRWSLKTGLQFSPLSSPGGMVWEGNSTSTCFW